ncbi:hypothetical protein EJ110_NYTH55388 [Nymphaea thermarum]|nr:hypothetical protein EJ110_NYTH55388 [Nymphaea thermarum]
MKSGSTCCPLIACTSRWGSSPSGLTLPSSSSQSKPRLEGVGTSIILAQEEEKVGMPVKGGFHENWLQRLKDLFGWIQPARVVNYK